MTLADRILALPPSGRAKIGEPWHRPHEVEQDVSFAEFLHKDRQRQEKKGIQDA